MIEASRIERLVISLHDRSGGFLGTTDFHGGGASLSVGYRQLIEQVLAHRAEAILLMHNHPSGDTRPSSSDIAATAALTALCRPLEINLIDHLVVGGASVTSMRRAGLLAGDRGSQERHI